MAPRTSRVEGPPPTSTANAGESSGCTDSAALPAANNDQGEKDDLYTHLWYACAGANVYVPRPGEKVFYFLQGHMEQVEAYANQDGKMELPRYNLPPKILCNVVCVQLKAEVHTDEVYAQITLLPVTEQDQLSAEEENTPPLPRRTSTISFSKTLTPSDTSSHGGFSVPKRQAEECLPALDMSQQPPVQDLVAKDLQGNEWSLRHIFRVVLENFKIPHCAKAKKNAISMSMQHGILASAFHAISTGTIFTVYYRPWTSPAAFIIPYDRYMKSAEIDYSIGMRFRMYSEGEECADQKKRLEGTIIDIEDNDYLRWPDSEWRCLKVRLDTASDTCFHSERLSPWNIVPLKPNKRARLPDLPSPGISSLARNGSLLISVESTRPRKQKVFQGQETSDPPAHEPGTPKQLLQSIPPPNPDWDYTQLGLENNLNVPMNDSFYQCPGSSKAPSLTNQWPPMFGFGVFDSGACKRSMSVPNIWSSGSQKLRTFELMSETQSPLVQPKTTMLFGVKIVTSYPELPSPQVANSIELYSPCSTPPIYHSSVSETIQRSETSKSVSGVRSEKQCRKCCSVSNRSRIKVLKHGAPVGRSIDLTRFDGYNELIRELDQMFDFKGSLIGGSSGWQVTYMDDVGDRMLVGDHPWQLRTRTYAVT
ncbi:hypothetical protein C1H46_019406 [Malus baccata]|uniref:Auxin-responsive protein n=1 Tax=Malus baccata TaxID=106549 RepID=A0A540M8C5_MALBA|nr:hypothetical protein C1H46_019406 [Malus baccata]